MRLHQPRHLLLVGDVKLSHLALALVQLVAQPCQAALQPLYRLLVLQRGLLLLQRGRLEHGVQLLGQQVLFVLHLHQLPKHVLVVAQRVRQLLLHVPVLAHQPLHQPVELQRLRLAVLDLALHVERHRLLLRRRALLLPPHLPQLLLQPGHLQRQAVPLALGALERGLERGELGLWVAQRCHLVAQHRDDSEVLRLHRLRLRLAAQLQVTVVGLHLLKLAPSAHKVLLRRLRLLGQQVTLELVGTLNLLQQLDLDQLKVPRC
mmetsp:Transcript_35323/g.89421  ORF Transcript_35323/g.89421 Transcript_35323/m.89421 type:complete len:262 (-) Transcript_35323:370-1155(-)